jgi:iron complex outermembrane receptor protein
MKKLSEKFRPLFIGLMMILLITGSIRTYSQESRKTGPVVPSTDTIYKVLNEVVITATRVPQRIIDIPFPVMRLSYQNFQFDRKVGSDDMLSSVPGMFLQSRYGTHDVRFSIRGFGSRSNSGVRGVRILLDDIPESEPDGQTRLEAIDFNTLSRIEIVKGNASSLYTNAPGGVVNFINNLDFERSFVAQFNQFGSFGLRKNGIQGGVRTDHYGALGSYSYETSDGYREHNNEYWNVVNLLVETNPTQHSSLKILGYFVDGEIKLPGSLTKSEFEENPYQADQRSIDRDEKRITTKGRIGIRYNSEFGKKLNNEIEVTTYGTIKVLERTAGDYRIISRDGFGFSARYINRVRIGKRTNEFSVGTDLYAQPARIEYYDNINGSKGDQILQLQKENINNYGVYFSENFEILKEKMFVLLTGRYDYVFYKLQEETLPSRIDDRKFAAFTPKLALNYKLTPWMALYTSFGYSFDAPANNELDSPDPAYLFNSELQPQESKNFELGIKGNFVREDAAHFFRKCLFEATFFNVAVNNEIVPYEVLGDVFYRNAARTNRLGLEAGGRIEIIRDLNFGIAYTYSYFKYSDYTARTIEIDSAGNFIQTDEDFAGNIVPSVPRNNLYLSLSYAHKIIKQIGVFGKVSYQGISGLWVDDANTDKTKSYNLLNGLVGFDMRFGKFNVQLSGGVNNIFDVVYVGFTNTNSANGRFYEPGAPMDLFCTLNLGYTF